MIDDIKKLLEDLKETPLSEKVDHILILEKLYWKHSKGIPELEPIAMFYINGFDDLPALKEKQFWNTDNYNKLMEHFIESHPILIRAVNEVLDNY